MQSLTKQLHRVISTNIQTIISYSCPWKHGQPGQLPNCTGTAYTMMLLSHCVGPRGTMTSEPTSQRLLSHHAPCAAAQLQYRPVNKGLEKAAHQHRALISDVRLPLSLGILRSSTHGLSKLCVQYSIWQP